VGADGEAEPVGSWLTDVVIPLKELPVPLLLREDGPLGLVYWLGDEAGLVADRLPELDIETDLLELRAGDAPVDELLLP
jgi:hypothetical protein